MSLDFDNVKKYYPTLWDEKKVLMAVEKGKITEAQFEEIVGKSIYEIGSLEEAMTRKQEQNKKALASFLENSSIEWTDGERYGVTQDDQIELMLNKSQYEIKKASNGNAVLQWHSKRKICREFSEEEFATLTNAIIDFVYPYVEKCQEIKEQIYSSTSYEELKNIFQCILLNIKTIDTVKVVRDMLK